MDSCPNCQRAFKSIYDFPRVYIKSAERIPLPFPIHDGGGPRIEDKVQVGFFRKRWKDNPDLPAVVLKQLRAGKESVVFGGRVYMPAFASPSGNEVHYYYAHDDVTPEFQERYQHPDVQEALAFLDSVVEREVSTQELLNGLKVEKDNEKGIKKLLLTEHSLTNYAIQIFHHADSLRDGSVRYYNPIDVARFEYEGRVLRSHSPSP